MKQQTKLESMPKLGFVETEVGIKLVKDVFERKLAEKLNLLRVTAPRFLRVGKGLQDDLAGTQQPVSFRVKFTDDEIEVVHSLAKWKRWTLGKHGFTPGTGLYTDMDAIRKDEDVSPIHSVYVDQWDWELVIGKDDRTIGYLKQVVEKIYSALLETEAKVHEEFPVLVPSLVPKITFIHSQQLEDMYQDLAPREREREIARKHGAVFIIGIGHPLRSGKPHDLRAADYDDWSTMTELGPGLNGDIIVWDRTRQDSLELSSMGTRIDSKAMLRQLEHAGLSHRKQLEFHRGVIEGSIPLTIGGGIGQSRLCMLLLQKSHIGQVQSSVWPEEVVEEFARRGIALL